MWSIKKIDKEIKAGEPLIYLDDGRWFGAYKPSDDYGVIYSCGSATRNNVVEWGRLRVAEWSEQLGKEG